MLAGVLLHVGCGKTPLPEWAEGYTEVRVDVDDRCNPDIVASMLDLGEIGEYDALVCNHALEHLTPYEVDIALQEFKRVLKPGGYALITVPDLEDVRPTRDVVYESEAGPVTGLDMYYGMEKFLPLSPFMAHKTGFIRDTLLDTVKRAGFSAVEVRRTSFWNLLAVVVK